ncbi:MAG: hypothetical protein K1Y36_21785 [Blastocatellia bacterium]|nr:hypothetical protein [Blastocatellia bacterium]
MCTLKTGNNRVRRQAGFSFLELLFVTAVLFLIMAGLAGLLTEFARGERLKAYRSLMTIYQKTTEARTLARQGVAGENLRTVAVKDLLVPEGVQLVTDVKVEELPYPMPVLGPDAKITFEAQTARTVDKKWGIIIARDVARDTSYGVVIHHVPAPPQLYVKYPGQKSFQLMANNVY